jgi:hypothetical protein
VKDNWSHESSIDFRKRTLKALEKEKTQNEVMRESEIYPPSKYYKITAKEQKKGSDDISEAISENSKSSLDD